MSSIDLKDLQAEVLLGGSEIDNTPLRVFDPEVTDFIALLSETVLKSPVARQYPDLAALAFWGRRAHLKQLQEQFGETEGYVGRGLCLHIAPANIPINFAFSYLFALLAGNAGIVRLPSRNFPQIMVLAELCAKIIVNYPKVAQRSLWIRYPRQSDLSAKLSAIADLRMIWGGDQTIATFKAFAVKPRCLDVTFADRYSLMLIDAGAVTAATDEVIANLAKAFYNDTYLMDQNACSSPQLMLWLNDCKEGRNRFWQAVLKEASGRYMLQAATAVDKYEQLCADAMDNPWFKDAIRYDNLLYRIELGAIDTDVTKLRGRGGYFYEYALKDFAELISLIDERFQTVTYFGLDEKELQKQLIEAGVRGVDRIVPAGRALEIGTVWDGYDLLRILSRRIAFA